MTVTTSKTRVGIKRVASATTAKKEESVSKTNAVTEEDIPVSDLEVDPRVQRSSLKIDRVNNIVSNFNPDAIGRITVSLRTDRSYRVLDGWHRLEAVRRITSNQGSIACRVFRGLSLAEEGQLFLDLNAGDRPTTIDRYNVSIVAGIEEYVEIDKLVHAYGWKVAPTSGVGQLSCVVALRNLYRRSLAEEQDPNLLQMSLMAITRAWGTESAGAQAHLVLGVGRVIGEYKDRLDVSRLISAMRKYKGGPGGLTTACRAFATLRKVKMSMAVAEVLVDEYNVGLGPKRQLPRWSKRS